MVTASPKTMQRAVRWYRLSVEQGFAAAQYNLGLMYAIGDGVPEDDAGSRTLVSAMLVQPRQW